MSLTKTELEEQQGDTCPACSKGVLVLEIQATDVDEDGWPIYSRWLECNHCGVVHDGD